MRREGSNKPLVIDLAAMHRSHPLVSVLAEYLIETSLQGKSAIAARCAATVTPGVDRVTTVVLLTAPPAGLPAQDTESPDARRRVRSPGHPRAGRARMAHRAEAARLLECAPAGNLPRESVQREVAKALEALQVERPRLDALANQRAAELLQDHERVRQATARRSGGWPAPGAGLPAGGCGQRTCCCQTRCKGAET